MAGVLADHLPAAQADLPGAAAAVGDLGLQHLHPDLLITGGLGNANEFNLALYIYDKAFTFPPSYGLGGALALIFTLILLIVTVGYVRASVRQGALT